MRIPLTWPLGTYGLPMTKSGCPEGSFWHEGTRYHDTVDHNSNNYWSNPYDLAGRAEKNNMEQKFCMKTKEKTSGYNLPWPKGRYCIFKKGECPEGQCKHLSTRAVLGEIRARSAPVCHDYYGKGPFFCYEVERGGGEI